MTEEELQADVDFLLPRAHLCGFFRLDPNRDYGKSSNAIVRLAYGGKAPGDDELPRDMSDLLACERAYSKLPTHRKTPEVLAALERARAVVRNDMMAKEFPDIGECNWCQKRKATVHISGDEVICDTCWGEWLKSKNPPFKKE